MINSGWRNISQDNITALIGQNESGKTAILEALYSFSTGEIIEDVLRSDGSYPIVSCSFSIDSADIESMKRNYVIPENVIQLILSEGRINLTREWTELNESNVKIEQEEIASLYEEYEQSQQDVEGKIEHEIERILNKDSAEDGSKSESESESDELKSLATEINGLADRIDELKTNIEGIKNDINKLNKKLKKTNNPDEKRKTQSELKLKQENRDDVEVELNEKRRELNYNKTLFGKVLSGLSYEQAKSEISELLEDEKPFLNISGLANELIDKIPIFELFKDYGSLLPNTIDLIELENENADYKGYFGVINFLKVAGIDLNFFKQSSHRILEQQIEDRNEDITIDFQEFWSQKVGKTHKIKIQFELEHHTESNESKKGQPYLAFWIKDGREKLYPAQRSEGVRWFLSFYLQLKAYAQSDHDRGRVLLIDEPGNSLHAKAQEDVLKVFEEIKDKVQIIYATHSPYLLNIDHIYRILAVQREDATDDRSQSVIITSHELGSASTDTLSPLYTIMGASFAAQQAVRNENNVLLEEISAFYYLKAFFKLVGSNQEAYFLAATGVTKLPQLANLFLGWGLDFIVVVDDDSSGRKVYNQLKKDLYGDDDKNASEKLLKLPEYKGIEAIFTTTDFKRHILNDNTADIPDGNLTYLKQHNKSKGILALKFYLKVKNDEITFDDLNQITQSNIQKVVSEIEKRLKNNT